MVVSIGNDKAYNEHLKIANQKKKYLVIKFSSKWCGPCRSIQPYYDLLSKSTKNTYCVVVDVDSCPKTALKYQVRSLPSFVLVKDNTIKGFVAGADKNGLKRLFQSCR